jgi:Prolyl oligopeptidase, N-terminal beta-propeller domain/Glycoside hydrolase family 2 C-terminal domain 5
MMENPMTQRAIPFHEALLAEKLEELFNSVLSETLATKAKRSLCRSCVVFIVFAFSALAQGPSIPKPPETPKHPVTDEYFGAKVTDDYRWLENWDDPAVKQWSAAQNARTREYLDHLPARAAIKQRLQQLVAASSTAYWDLEFRGGTLFAMKYQPPQQQPMLVAMRGDGKSSGSYESDTLTLFNGRALVVVRASKTAGKIQLAAESSGLRGSSISLMSQPSSNFSELQ